ncbi:MAG TPA: hypothetical protein ENJ61_05080 [Aquifex aeolicus]|uniref:Peptidase C39 domain-containing protein n=1 Tax=Aquifex aeolicus TaxID=63363 RepID=A0A7C5L2T4_AQUAO|nr:hypothetical protein [Aquifex aeolicus]
MIYLILLFLTFLFGCSAKWEVGEGRTRVYMGSGIFGTVSLQPEVKPLHDLKFDKVVRQHYDYSCGSAAVATVTNYYLGLEFDEATVINMLFKVGNPEKIMKRKGFSLLDIKRLFETLGYRALGVKTTIETLAKVRKPAIVTIVIGNYKHYVVFRGVYEGRVVVSDPAFGTAVLPVHEFEKMWYKNIALIIDHTDIEETDLAVSEKELLIVKKDEINRNLINYSLPVYRTDKDF